MEFYDTISKMSLFILDFWNSINDEKIDVQKLIKYKNLTSEAILKA